MKGILQLSTKKKSQAENYDFMLENITLKIDRKKTPIQITEYTASIEERNGYVFITVDILDIDEDAYPEKWQATGFSPKYLFEDDRIAGSEVTECLVEFYVNDTLVPLEMDELTLVYQTNSYTFEEDQLKAKCREIILDY